ncbi:MAG: cysteine--tRNA ligase [Candidatus Paceibacterota bacterium]
MLKIFNTLSAKKESLKPPRLGYLKLFVCGPTVYDYSHIGHARTYIAFDIIVKYLRSQGYKTFYLQNITDVDNKIINRAKTRNLPWKTLSRRFEKEYLKDMKTLGINSVTKYARATDHIKEVISQVKKLLKKGFAYEISDGIYYDISRFKDYGKLSKRTVSQAEDAVSRIDETKEKRNRGDFCLWKFSKPGEPKWKSPFGDGRPGWHIEDTAITEKYFGPQYDLHGGALDLKFPHHESEIAQQEAASGKKPFVKIWLHTGFLLVKSEKMSKSLGNFITIRNFLKKYPSEVLRFIVLSHHYRSPIDYNEKLANNAVKSIDTIREFLEKLEFVRKSKILIHSEHSDPPARVRSSEVGRGVIRIVRIADKKFNQVMNDDFNTPKALAVIFDFISSLQDKIWQIKPSQVKSIIQFINEKLGIFGIKIKPVKIPQKIKALAEQREKLRANKQFILADRLRNKIESLGYKVEDTPFGPMVQKNF